MIVTFLAVLEMIRLKLIRVFQAGSFGEIRVYKERGPPTDRIRSAIRKVTNVRDRPRHQGTRTELQMSDNPLTSMARHHLRCDGSRGPAASAK